MLRRRLRPPSTESLFVAALVLFGFRLGAHAIGDNSMFAHLRTGIDMASGRGVPRADVYSYTAHGHPWVVQSWLAELSYGWAYRLWDLRLVVIEQAVLTAAVAWLVVRLARTGSALRTAAAGTIAMGVGAAYWSQRPLLFGLLSLALLVTVVNGRRSAWWLLPIGWFWVNTHGSFLLAVPWLAAWLVGEGLDRRSVPKQELRYVPALLAGLAIGAVNPFGARLLSFGLNVGSKRDVFKTIVEWRSPDFQQSAGLFALAFLTLAVVVLARARVGWREVLPTAAFVALGLLAVRNLPMAAVVMAPALGRALWAPDTADGSRPAATRPPLNLVFLGAIALAVLLFAATVWGRRPLDVRAYPVAMVTRMERAGLLGPQHHVAHQDVVGGYLILRLGRKARVFVDDRYDMYPLGVADDYETLLRGKPGWARALDRHRVDVVLWQRTLPLVSLLRADGHWHQVLGDKDWVVLTRSA